LGLEKGRQAELPNEKIMPLRLKKINAALIIFSVVSNIEAFQVQNKNAPSSLLHFGKNVASMSRFCPSFTRLKMAKGFGEPKKQNKPKQNDEMTYTQPNVTKKSVSVDDISNQESMNAGQRALADLREQREARKFEEVRKVKELLSTDELLDEDGSAAVIPEKVAMRMGSRMIPFVGIPLFGGMGAFIAFWYFATYRGVEFQPVVVAGTTISLLAVSLAGITYSLMSSSWDPDDDGTGIGIDEFKNNVGNIKAGLKRSKENAVIREKMAGLPEGEIRRAIEALDKRDEREKKKQQRLEEMLLSNKQEDLNRFEDI